LLFQPDISCATDTLKMTSQNDTLKMTS
jgi:hypothetical protein